VPFVGPQVSLVSTGYAIYTGYMYVCIYVEQEVAKGSPSGVLIK